MAEGALEDEEDAGLGARHQTGWTALVMDQAPGSSGVWRPAGGQG